MEETCRWTGASGTPYTYYVHEIKATYTEGQIGNYIFCKRNGTGWTPLYIGEGDLKTRTEFRKKQLCIINNNATHIHTRLNANEDARLKEEKDILASHPESYEPIGCNVKEGG